MYIYIYILILHMYTYMRILACLHADRVAARRMKQAVAITLAFILGAPMGCLGITTRCSVLVKPSPQVKKHGPVFCGRPQPWKFVTSQANKCFKSGFRFIVNCPDPISHHFSPFLTISHHFSPFLTISHHFSPFLTISHHFSPFLTISHHFSPFLTISHHFSPFLTISHHFSPFLTISHHFSPFLTISHHFSPFLTISHHNSD